MGMFDIFKDAFSAPALENNGVSSERETPIDRWMGWSTKAASSEETQQAVVQTPKNFIDSMDEANYVTVLIEKPMGIVFEENDDEFGGIFVLSLNEDGMAEKNGSLKPGDQLIAVDGKQVQGQVFDKALGTIIESTNDKVKLVFFRGTAALFYGPTGASKEWLTELVSDNKATSS